jgi:hypothetical protein
VKMSGYFRGVKGNFPYFFILIFAIVISGDPKVAADNPSLAATT